MVLLEYSVVGVQCCKFKFTQQSSNFVFGDQFGQDSQHRFAAQLCRTTQVFLPPPSLADLKDVESSKIVPSESGLSKKRGRNGDNWGPSKLTGNLMGRSSILRIELRPNTVRHGF